MSPDDMKRKTYDGTMPTVESSEKAIAKDLPKLEARLNEAKWPADKKASFLDLLLGKKDS